MRLYSLIFGLGFLACGCAFSGDRVTIDWEQLERLADFAQERAPEIIALLDKPETVDSGERSAIQEIIERLAEDWLEQYNRLPSNEELLGELQKSGVAAEVQK